MSAPDTHNEHSPLLGTDHVSDPLASASRKRIVMIAASTLVLACDFGFYLTTAPQTEIFQDIICRNYMATLGKSSDTIPTEAICKSEPVQSELALVNGWKETSDVLPGMSISLFFFKPCHYALRITLTKVSFWPSPTVWRRTVGGANRFSSWGYWASCWGRFGCVWCVSSITRCTSNPITYTDTGLYSTLLPLRLVWLSGMWRLIGGGDMALSSISLVMVADVFPREEMYAQNVSGLDLLLTQF